MIEIQPDDLAAAADAFPSDVPVVMINLLRFRDRADYPHPSGLEPCTGREAYFERYIPAFNRTVEPIGETELLFAGDVEARLVGPVDEAWDAIALVRYADFGVFGRLVTDAAYLDQAEPHRSAALADWRLHATAALGEATSAAGSAGQPHSTSRKAEHAPRTASPGHGRRADDVQHARDQAGASRGVPE